MKNVLRHPLTDTAVFVQNMSLEIIVNFPQKVAERYMMPVQVKCLEYTRCLMILDKTSSPIATSQCKMARCGPLFSHSLSEMLRIFINPRYFWITHEMSKIQTAGKIIACPRQDLAASRRTRPIFVSLATITPSQFRIWLITCVSKMTWLTF